MNGLLEDCDTDKYMQSYRNLLDVQWFDFPGDFQKYVGFDDWAKHHNYEYATSHPLKQAHVDASSIVVTHICDNILVY